MDYLLTFEDGSSGYLAHYGVKGMKWGVWNSETKAKYGHLKGSDNTQAFNKYIKADQTAWRNSNGAYSHPNPVSKLKSNLSQKKLKEARSNLADSILEDYAQHPINISPDKNFDIDHKQLLRNLHRNVDKDGWSEDEGLAYYKDQVNMLENERQIRKAVAQGKDAVEHYIQYGTNDRPRSSIEYAANHGIAVPSEKDGDRFRKIKEEKDKATREITRFESDPSNWAYASDGQRKPKTPSLQKKFDRLYDEWERTDGNYRDFQSEMSINRKLGFRPSKYVAKTKNREF